jgi:lysophospholipase L1-like esterase
VLSVDGRIELRKGTPHVSLQVPPDVAAGERRLANIWVTARLGKLTEDNVFPVLEETFPKPPKELLSAAEKFFPRALAKLEAGERLRILAWGDSVTDGGYLPEPEVNRWQEQFVRQLRDRYPIAEVVLMTEAWGGRKTDDYRNEPPESPKNYKEKVLDVRPDLIVTEFVNDAGLSQAETLERYERIRDEFRGIGAEWILLTPHYIRPDWMGLTSEKDIDNDPREYVRALRRFTAENRIALAEGSLRYGRLWRQGIPYSTLMMNNINHPNPYGQAIFADALMALFP